MRLRGGRMIVNPVRYGVGGAVKQITVTVNSMMATVKYYVQNGKIVTTDRASFQADAGSMLTVVSSGSFMGPPSVSGATQGASTNNGVTRFYLVDA